MLSDKFIYHFSQQKTEGSKSLSHLLGGKGAHLAEMSSIGLPVPPGFTITSEMSLYFYKNGKKLPQFFKARVKKEVEVLEKQTGREFGSTKNPLLLSVRSGAKVSMPGMMDTILNLGMTQKITEQMAQKESRMAWDCYRRLISMYGDVVLGADASTFIFIMEDYKAQRNYKNDTELTAHDLEKLSFLFKEQILQTTGEEFPEDPEEQLFRSISAVFESWNNSRAVAYRDLHSYSHESGTAVNVQTMVFGNQGKNSATGVLFTRNPNTGEPGLFGEFLPQAQGEDVVAGIRTPLPIRYAPNSLEVTMPQVFEKLSDIAFKLEKHFKDMQDIEFTIEEGQLWILQARKGKRSIQAALRIAVNLVQEGLLTEEEAILSVPSKNVEQILHPSLDPKAEKKYLAKGLAASPGGACGKIIFSSNKAAHIGPTEKVILVRSETSPEDIKGMVASQGILTIRGGMTSHAAVVARGMGKCCIVGCQALRIEEGRCWFRDTQLNEGEKITLNGTTGEIFLGEVPMVQPQLDSYFHQFMELLNRHSQIRVKANADTPEDSKIALNFGASGVGLCRTEHMFFQEDRLDIVRKMILFQGDKEKETSVLNSLLEKQKQDFYEIFKVMENLPVCVRLLDPPLHEFLPQNNEEIKKISDKWGENYAWIKERVEYLKEVNPMLGHRGCRLAITFPELYETQVRAIGGALIDILKEKKKCFPEIMIPLVGFSQEFVMIRSRIQSILNEVQGVEGVQFSIPIGTMIEIPRAALVAHELVEEADFFSFGSNDLTQTTLGISRDDCSRFLPSYIEKGLIQFDPFVRLEGSVGWLIRYACNQARQKKKDFPLGLCGEHGADPQSISFCRSVGLTSISCSPYRIPVARLALAQSQIYEKIKSKGQK